MSAVCDIVAATNIQALSLNQWSCDSNGIPLSSPCSWSYDSRGAFCSWGYITSLHLPMYGLKGK